MVITKNFKIKKIIKIKNTPHKNSDKPFIDLSRYNIVFAKMSEKLAFYLINLFGKIKLFYYKAGVSLLSNARPFESELGASAVVKLIE